MLVPVPMSMSVLTFIPSGNLRHRLNLLTLDAGHSDRPVGQPL
jgi:hypothetical protein